MKIYLASVAPGTENKKTFSILEDVYSHFIIFLPICLRQEIVWD